MLLISSQFDSLIKSSWIGRVRESHVRNGITIGKYPRRSTKYSPNFRRSVQNLRWSNPSGFLTQHFPRRWNTPNETLLWCWISSCLWRYSILLGSAVPVISGYINHSYRMLYNCYRAYISTYKGYFTRFISSNLWPPPKWLAMRISQASANSNPPVMAKPFTAQILRLMRQSQCQYTCHLHVLYS